MESYFKNESNLYNFSYRSYCVRSLRFQEMTIDKMLSIQYS